jgi:hypothetical protein
MAHLGRELPKSHFEVSVCLSATIAQTHNSFPGRWRSNLAKRPAFQAKILVPYAIKFDTPPGDFQKGIEFGFIFEGDRPKVEVKFFPTCALRRPYV